MVSIARPATGCGLLAALAIALFLAPAAAVKPISDWESGFITHYGGAQDGMDPNSPSFGTSVGACGYGMISKTAFPYWSVAAFSPSNHYYQAGPSGACGQCFQIQCVGGRNGKGDYCKTDAQGNPLSILVMISDVCPECEAEHVDVQSLAFAKLADPSIGNIDMRYRRVECNVPKNIEVDVMNFGGTGQWLRLSITDTGGYASVKSVSVKSSSGSGWQTMDNTWGAVWEVGQSPGAPLDFQIECTDGQIVTANSVVKQNGGISGGPDSTITFTTDVQFNIDDPAATSVQSFDGPSDPMVVTSSTPGNSDSGEGGSSSSSASSSSSSSSSSSTSPPSPSNNSSSSSPDSSCSDTQAPDGYTCEQQKQWGKCSDEYFTSNNYCAQTCGRCGSSSPSSSGASPSPSGGNSSCQDKVPSGDVSCQQRKDWGQCSQSWLTSGGYCQATCGTCGSSSPSDGSSSSNSNDNSSSSTSDSCSDNVPSGGATCDQQKQWGACDQSWMTSGNYCAQTCGRCGSSSSSSSGNSSPQVQSYSGPSGRRLLSQQ